MLFRAHLPGCSAQRGFENPWHVATALQQTREELFILGRQWNVVTIAVEGAEVHMAKATGEAIEHRTTSLK